MSDQREPRQLTDNSYPEGNDARPVVRGILVIAVALVGTISLPLGALGYLDFLDGPWEMAIIAVGWAMMAAWVIRDVVCWINRRDKG